MNIRRIELASFRNYKQQVIETNPGINVFYGDNAQGKTNVLESVYLCACARSHRTARDSDLIRHDDDFYRVAIDFTSHNGAEETVEIEYIEAVPGDPGRSRSQRRVSHDGLKLDRIGQLMGIFNAVIFAPEDLMMIKEGPSTRRRFLDLLISQVRPSYFGALQQTTRLLMQRNKLLKNLRDKQYAQKMKLDDSDMMQLDIFNQALAKHAAQVIHQRLIFTQKVGDLAGEAQFKISSGKEKLYVKYKTIAGLSHDNSIEEIYSKYYSKLKSNVYDEIDKGITTSGPHRDDLEMSLDGDQMKPFASQGQQRSAVLSLKLAELAILRQETGESPVLLLDDVMSELDEKRRISLLENIHEAQVFVTCTDAHQVVSEIEKEYHNDEEIEKKEHPFTFFHVEDGTVSKVEEKDLV